MTLGTVLQNFAQRVATEFKSVRALINGGGQNLSGLNTTNKTNLVAAINEIQGMLGDAGAHIDDTAISLLTVWSSNKTDAQINAAVSALVDASPDQLNTLNELAAAIGDDPNFSATFMGLLGAKAPSANPSFTGTVTVPDGSFSIAKTVGLQGSLDSKITAFTDPNADRILFWDDSAGAFVALALAGLTISGTSMSVDAATETAQGVIELATLAEVATGTDVVRAVTPAGLAQQIATRAAATHTHTASQITDFSTAADARVNTLVPASTTTAAGKVLLATLADMTTGTESTKAATPAGVAQQIATRAAAAHTHLAADITNLQTTVDARVNTLVPQGSTTALGKLQLATLTEVGTGTDTAKAVTSAGVAQQIATRAATTHTHTASQITDFASSVDARIPATSSTQAGIVELATDLETATGTDISRAITPANLRSVIGDPEQNLVTVFEAALV